MAEDVDNFAEALQKMARMPDGEFRLLVSNKLTKIETKLDDALGNGRLGYLEKKVRFHDRVLWMAMGGVGLIVFLTRFL